MPYPVQRASLAAQKRWLTTASTSATDASCYTLVKNGGGKLVGQILGDCYTIKNPANGDKPSGGVNMCLNVNTAIDEDTGFTTYGFVKRVVSGGTTTYTDHPVKTGAPAAASSGSQICGLVDLPTEAGSTLCPGKLVADPSAATADTGKSECPAVVEQLKEMSIAIQMIGGAAMAGTDTLVVEKKDVSQITPQVENRNATRQISAKVTMTMDIGSVTCEIIEANEALIKAFSSGLTDSVNVPSAQLTIDSFNCALARRRILEQAKKDNLTPQQIKRRLASADLNTEYTVYLPRGMEGIDTIAGDLASSMTEGNPAAALFSCR